MLSGIKVIPLQAKIYEPVIKGVMDPRLREDDNLLVIPVQTGIYKAITNDVMDIRLRGYGDEWAFDLGLEIYTSSEG